jgi:membrane protein YdbS with pleckstrin-like domain
VFGFAIGLICWLGIGVVISAVTDVTQLQMFIGLCLGLPHANALRRYFATDQYERSTPEQAAQLASIYVLAAILFASAFVIVTEFQSVSLDDPRLLSTLVLAKVGIDLLVRKFDWPSTWQRVKIDGHPFARQLDLTEKLSLSRYYAQLPAVSTPNGPAHTVVSPRAIDLLGASIKTGFIAPRAGPLSTVVVLASLLLWVLGKLTPALFVIFGLAAILILCGAGIARTVPQSLTLEYRIHDDSVSCYDRWLGELQWTISFEQVREIELEQGIIGRLFGFGTVVIETADGNRARIAHVQSHERIDKELES